MRVLDPGCPYEIPSVAAITKTIPPKLYPFTVFVPAGVLRLDSTILCNQLLTIDKTDLLIYRGELDEALIRQVDRALTVALGLPRPQ